MIKKQSTILIVDDTETNVDILLKLLDGYDLLVAIDGQGAINIAQEEDLDLILLDIMMPNMDGFETCRVLKNSKKTKHIPIIFSTAKTDEESIEMAYNAGGVDFISKPFKPKEVLARIRTHLRIKSLIEDLEYKSFHDEMTGIYNRRKFFELSQEMFDKKEKNFYVVMLDIDKFKNINDKYGHQFGDKIIKEIVNLISDKLQGNAVFGRIGGEEFCISIHCSSMEKMIDLLENIRVSITSLIVMSDDLKAVPVTISTGFARYNSSFLTLDSLLNDADNALYEAKGKGRNKVIFRG